MILNPNHLEPKTVLIIGGCGFIGGHLTHTFLAKGWKTMVLDPSPLPFNQPNPNLVHFQGSLADLSLLGKALSNSPDVILHAFSNFKGASDFEGAILDLQGNIFPTLHLLEMASSMPAALFVFLSSGGAIYGKSTDFPIKETTQLKPINDYGQSKRILESYIEYYSQKGLKTLVFRPGNVYGPNQISSPALGLINELLNGIVENRTISMFGNGIRDYLHVQDLCNGIFRAAELKTTGVFNIGTGIGTSVEHIITLISEITGFLPLIDRKHARKGDVDANILAIDKLKSELDWQPEISLKRGLEELWALKMKT